jgi:transposase
VPTPWCSGSIEREQGISKAGNRRLHRFMIELSWLSSFVGHVRKRLFQLSRSSRGSRSLVLDG